MEWLNSLTANLGWTLLHFVWQGLLIGVAHEIALHAARNSSPRFRYGISLCALIVLMLLPLITFVMLASGAGESSDPSGTAPAAPAAMAAMAAMPKTIAETGVAAMLESALPYVVIAWLVGVCLLTLRFGVGLLTLRELVRQADYDAVSDWMRDELERLTTRMGISRRVRIALSTKVNSPLVVGWLRPVIFLPLSAATGLDHQQIRLVLAHELAHLRRYDHFVNLLQVVAETILFYHPAVHRISRSLRQEREQCCDDIAVEVGGNRIAYARVLAELEEMRQQESARVLALGIADQELFTRIERLVRNSNEEQSKQRWVPVLLIAIAGMLTASQTLDFDAPLLPAVFEPARSSHRVPLQLPSPVHRDFTPIREPMKVDETPIDTRPAPTETIDETLPAEATVTTKASNERQRAPVVASAPSARENEKAVALDTTGSTDEPLSIAAPEPVVIAGGELVRAVEPRYPRRALRAGQEGEVNIAFTITAEGNVTDAVVMNAEPRGVFDAAALAAISEWKYRPFTENGTAVARRVTQVMEFRLSDRPLRGGTPGTNECREQTGTRLCRAAESEGTRLTILND